jgi:integrase
MADKIKFTDRTISSLPCPSDGRAEYADTETSGLRLRISASGIKTFSLLRRVKHGPMERVTLGRFPDDLKTEKARSEAARLNGVIAGGANPGEVKRAHKGEPTFSALFDEYMRRHAKLKKRTWREDEQKYRDYLAKELGKQKVSKIDRKDISAIHSRITMSGHPTVANRVKELVSSVFGRGIEWGYLDQNPARGIKRNPEKSRDRFLSGGELPRLFAALAVEQNENFRHYFSLALLTGARRANVRAMAWADLDLSRGEWRIPVTKNGQPQNVPLVPEALAMLNQRKEAASKDAVFVFPTSRSDSKVGYMSGERKAWLRVLDRDELTQLEARIEAAGGGLQEIEGETLNKTLARARSHCNQLKIKTDDARLPDVRIHDLRRTMGSWQARTGASMLVIGKSLGHKSQQATAIYARLDLDPVRQAMEAATSAMLEAAGEKEGSKVIPLKSRAT